MKRPDLLILVAIWQFVSAFLLLIGIVALSIFSFPEALGFLDGPVNTGSIFGHSIAIFFLLCLIGLSLAGGIGVLKAKSWGRIISMVNAILSLFNIPIGTVIGIFVLMYLSKTEVREYFEGSQ
jgi:hypothetical protein